MRPCLIASLSLVLTTLVVGTSHAEERPIAIKDLPAHILKSANEALEDAQWSEASAEVEEDDTTYHVRGVDGRGHKAETLLADDGELLSVRVDFEARDLRDIPIAIRRAASKMVQGATWQSVTSLMDDENSSYLFTGVDGSGKKVEATVTLEMRTVVETELDPKELPAPVAEAVAKQPDVTWDRIVSQREGDETRYEAEGKDAKGHEVSLAIDVDGEPTTRVTQGLDELPQAVLDAVRTKVPTFEAESAYLVIRRSVREYLLEGQNGDETAMKVYVSPDGKTVAVEEEEDE